MSLESSEKMAGVSLVSGLIIGQLVAIGLSFFTATDLTVAITNGAGGGILIGLIPAYLLNEGHITDTKMLVPFSFGWGTFVGILVGLLVAWSRSLPYLGGFSYGASGGMITGAAVGLILWNMVEK